MSAHSLFLEAHKIVKRYPGNVALDHVDIRLYRGAVNVLIGENGAGKSTLMRILSGVESCDAGTILIEGLPITLRSPRDAAALGIAIVHQELSVLPNLAVSENIFAGRERTRAGFIDRRAQEKQSAQALTRMHKPMRVDQPASMLSLGSRQIVELARCLAHDARMLILDEPTSALSTTETEALFSVLQELKNAGVTIVYISHRLHELLHLGDYFTVLRSGRVVGEARMSGREETLPGERLVQTEAPVILAARNLSMIGGSSETAASSPLHQVSLDLRKGEILGVYGVLGAGRTELMEALAGSRMLDAGSISLKGKPIELTSVEKAVRAGIVLVPEDRQRDGLIPELSIRENITLAASTGLFLSRKEETTAVRELAGQLNIAARNLELPVNTLSGGNAQKVLIARCLMRKPVVLLLDEPTRGVDVGAKAEIYRILRRLAAKGLSILFTSSEIEETRTLCDRVLVLRQGAISAEYTQAELTDELLFTAASPQVEHAA
jgi:erythritol transport system ATP-binding protein